MHFDLVSPVFGCRVDHLGRQTGGSRPLVEMLSFDSWREADHDRIYRLQHIEQSLEKEVKTLRGQIEEQDNTQPHESLESCSAPNTCVLLREAPSLGIASII